MRRPSIFVPLILCALACRDTPPTAPAIFVDSPIVRPNAAPLRMDLGTLGGPSSYANDINRGGTVVGTADNAGGLRRAFRWTVQGDMTDLGTLPGDDWSAACCITDDGQILGVSGLTSTSTSRGTPVIWSPDGTITALTIPLLPGAVFGQPSGFNGQGDVVGWDVFANQHAWIWSEAEGKYDITAHVPGGSSEGAASHVDVNGLVLGTNNSRAKCYRISSCWRPFLWSYESGYRELGTPEVDSTSVVSALGMNDGPTIVGWARTNALGSRPYVWREDEGYTILASVAGGYATSINTRGTAVGVAWDPALSAYQATAWSRSGEATRLSPEDPNPQIALAINEFGVVAGWASQGGGVNHATLWVLGPGASPIAQRAARQGPVAVGTVSAMAVAAAAAANACWSNVDALVSRAALFACEAPAAR